MSVTDPELSNSLPSKPLQENHHLWKLRHLSTSARYVKNLWHCWSTEANEHIGFHPNQMWTPHYACTDQWSDTKCKDWKQDWSRHLQKHQNMSRWLPIISLSPVYPACILPFHLNRYHLSSLLLAITSLSCDPLNGSSIDVYRITIDPKFADEIWFLGSDESKINQVEREIPGSQQACM